MECNNYLTDNTYEKDLPRAVYNQCIWIVRDMDRLRELAVPAGLDPGTEDVAIYVTDEGDMVRGSVAARAGEVLDCIHTALEVVPEGYRAGILDNIISKKSFGTMAHLNTWKKWKKIFLTRLAVSLNLI